MSVALSQSQLSQTSFGFGEQPSQWELDPTHPTESTFQQQQQQSPYQHQHQHNGAFDSVAQDNVFLTGVSGAEAEEGEEEEKRDGENGEGEKAQCRAGDINLTGAGRQWRLLNPVDRYEEAGKSYNSDDMLFYTDTDTPSAHTSRPITPHENNALPPRHFSETEGNVLSSNSRRDPHGAGGISSSSSTVRLIPVPEHVKDPPLKALLQSVSTLDIMKSKAQYSNIAVCRYSSC